MKVSVIIPTHDRWATLARTLPLVLAQDCPRDQYEVLVIDDGSVETPCTAVLDAERAGRIRFIRLAWGGHIKARNHGLRAASGEVILLLDDDIFVPPDLVRRHLDAHRGAGELVSYGPIFLAPDSPRTLVADCTGEWYRAHWARVAAQGGLRIPYDILLASNTAFSRAAVLAAGGFDEAAPSKDDTELGIRLWRRGVPMRFLPDAVAHEHFVKSSRAHVRGDSERWGMAETYICQKHPPARRGSGLGSFGGASWWKRAVRRAFVALPYAADAWLFVVYRAVELSGVEGAVRRLAMRLLEAHSGLAFQRGACRQAGGWAALDALVGARLPILLYHHVGPPPPGVPPSLTATAEKFEREVRWLAEHGYRGVRISDWTAWCREGKPLPPRPVAITLDDAYADIAEYALPTLERYGFGATVYVVTGEIGGTNGWDADKGIAALPLMDAAQIRQWTARGIEFGAHTRSHLDLTKAAPARQREEMSGSAVDLERITGARTVSFAYPFGFHDADARDAAREIFDAAITCDEGINHLDTDPAQLRRTMVYPDDGPWALRSRLTFGWTPIHRLRSRLAIRRRLSALIAGSRPTG